MSQGRKGKLQQAVATKPFGVPPLQLQKNGGQLWRDTDNAAAASSARPTSAAATGSADALSPSSARGHTVAPLPADPRTWSWDQILASSSEHGTTERPYNRVGGKTLQQYRSQFEPAVAPSSSHDANTARSQLESSSGRRTHALPAPGSLDSYIAHTQTRHTTTTTTVTQQVNTSESITTLLPIDTNAQKPRAVGDGGTMLSYGREDGPSRFTTAMLPALRSSERDELSQLSEALDFFLSKLEASRLKHVRLDDRGSLEQLLSVLQEEEGLYSLFFEEIIRQVGLQSRERGAILAKIREAYTNMFRRIPLHLYSLQSELSTQQALNTTLTEEARRNREVAFATQVELGAYTHRFKEAAHELEMHKDLLSRAEHEKDRARAMFTQFKSEWDSQRTSLEAQLQLMKEQREDYLANTSATATALIKAKHRPNMLVHSLLDESDSDEERINARLAFLKDMAQDDDTELLSTTVLQIERDQQKKAEESKKALMPPTTAADADGVDAETDASPNALDANGETEAQRHTRIAELKRQQEEANQKEALAKREAEAIQRAAMQAEVAPVEDLLPVAAATTPSASPRLRAAGSSSSSSRKPTHHVNAPSTHFSLSALPDVGRDFEQGYESDSLIPDRFRKPRTAAERVATPAERRAMAERREAKRVRHNLARSSAAQEALQAQGDLLSKWIALPSKDEAIAQLASLLPTLPREEIQRVAVHPKYNACIPMLIDFLTRIESCAFNQSELLLLRSSLPCAPGMPSSMLSTVWQEALTLALSERGLGAVTAELFSRELERKAYLAALAQDLSSSSSEEERPAAVVAEQNASATLNRSEDSMDDLNALTQLADPRASESVRNAAIRKSLEAQPADSEGPVTAAINKELRQKKKLAREDRRSKRSTGGTNSNSSSRPSSGRAVPAAASHSPGRGRSVSGVASGSATNSPSLGPSSRATGASATSKSSGLKQFSLASARGGSSTSSLHSNDSASAAAESKGSGGKKKGSSSRATGSNRRSSAKSMDMQHSTQSSDRSHEHSLNPPQHSHQREPSSVFTSRVESDDLEDLQVELVGASSQDTTKRRSHAGSSDDEGVARDPRQRPSAASGSQGQPKVAAAAVVDPPRRKTLPNAAERLASAASAAVVALKPPEPVRAKSIASGLQPPQHRESNSNITHHRHHSRAEGHIPPVLSSGGQDLHPILTLSGEHAEAANDPRANDDHEIMRRPAPATPAGVVSTDSAILPEHMSLKPHAPRRDPVDARAPRSFYQASQLMPVSKIVVAPRGNTAGAALETPRERELQGIIDDLITQNELLHAQRQALAQMQGLKDSGAPALPPSLTGTGGQQVAGISDGLTPMAVQSAAHSGLSTADKQNHLLKSVNSYLQAYRMAKKVEAAADGGASNSGNAVPGSLTARLGSGDSARHSAAGSNNGGIAPSVGFPGSSSTSTARNALSGQRNLLFNSRFLQLIKSQQHQYAQRNADGERKEANVDVEINGKKKPPTTGGASLSLVWVVKWIRALYDAKLSRDEIARQEGVPLLRLPEFLLEMQRKRYGLESLCHAKTWDVLLALNRWRDQDREVALFAAFLEESRPLDELILFLRTRAVVQASTVGILWHGHLHERAAVGAGASAAATKSCLEFMSLCRARSVISSIFANSVPLQDAVYREVVAHACFWHQLPDPIPAAKWALLLPGVGRGGLGAASSSSHVAPGPSQLQVDERCVSVVDFLDAVLAQFRSIEIQLRHKQWADELFDSAMASAKAQALQEQQESESKAPSPASDDRMDFACFNNVFSLAEPRYSSRDIASLYQNVTRQSGLKSLSRAAFKNLIHKLMSEGTMFPMLKTPDYESVNTVRLLLRHWSSFSGFVSHMLHRLSHSERAADVDAANNLSALKNTFEYELQRTAAGAGSYEGADTKQCTARLLSLYRGLLNVLSAHQSSFLLAAASPPPLRTLHTELKVMASVIMQRQRGLEGDEGKPDAWLDSVAALDADTTAPQASVLERAHARAITRESSPDGSDDTHNRFTPYTPHTLHTPHAGMYSTDSVDEEIRQMQARAANR